MTGCVYCGKALRPFSLKVLLLDISSQQWNKHVTNPGLGFQDKGAATPIAGSGGCSGYTMGSCRLLEDVLPLYVAKVFYKDLSLICRGSFVLT